MRANMGNIDRVLRTIVGILLISLVFIGPQAFWVWIGVMPLLAAFVTWCPAYVPFGVSTCREAPAT